MHTFFVALENEDNSFVQRWLGKGSEEWSSSQEKTCTVNYWIDYTVYDSAGFDSYLELSV